MKKMLTTIILFGLSTLSYADVLIVTPEVTFQAEFEKCMMFDNDSNFCSERAQNTVQKDIKDHELHFNAHLDDLFIAAAGDLSINLDSFPVSPANAESENLITVGASHNSNNIVPTSNIGELSVDIFVDASNTIEAAKKLNQTVNKMLHFIGDLTPAQIKEIILSTGDQFIWLQDYCLTASIVNEDRAIRAAIHFGNGYSMDEAIKESFNEIK